MWVRKLASSQCNLRYGVGSLNQEKRLYINTPFSLSPSSITVLCTLHCRLIHHSSLRFAFCTRIFFHMPLPPVHSTEPNPSSLALILLVHLLQTTMATQRITRSADRATAKVSNSANGTDY